MIYPHTPNLDFITTSEFTLDLALRRSIGFALVSTSFSLLMSFYLYLNIDMGAD
jgi:hypothetical protein